MYVVRVYTGDDGESHFEDVAIDLEDQGLGGRISRLIRGSGAVSYTHLTLPTKA